MGLGCKVVEICPACGQEQLLLTYQYEDVSAGLSNAIDFGLDFSLTLSFPTIKWDDWTRWLTFEVCQLFTAYKLGLFSREKKERNSIRSWNHVVQSLPLYLPLTTPSLAPASVWHLPLPTSLTLQRPTVVTVELSVNTLGPLYHGHGEYWALIYSIF